METTTPRIIPRPRQRKAAKAVVENLLSDDPKTLGEIMASSGYGSGAITTPSVVTESKGFKQALYELGLTEELITTALVEDITLKKQNRLGELRLGAELLGLSKPKDEPVQQGNKTTYNFIFSAETQEAIKAMEDQLKARLTAPHVEQD